jgi:hypothetical protein
METSALAVLCVLCASVAKNQKLLGRDNLADGMIIRIRHVNIT